MELFYKTGPWFLCRPTQPSDGYYGEKLTEVDLEFSEGAENWLRPRDCGPFDLGGNEFGRPAGDRSIMNRNWRTWFIFWMALNEIKRLIMLS